MSLSTTRCQCRGCRKYSVESPRKSKVSRQNCRCVAWRPFLISLPPTPRFYSVTFPPPIFFPTTTFYCNHNLEIFACQRRQVSLLSNSKSFEFIDCQNFVVNPSREKVPELRRLFQPPSKASPTSHTWIPVDNIQLSYPVVQPKLKMDHRGMFSTSRRP